MMCAGLAACKGGGARQEETPPAGPQRDRVEVLYFHTPKRCATCAAIEEETRRVVEEQFAGQLCPEKLLAAFQFVLFGKVVFIIRINGAPVDTKSV